MSIDSFSIDKITFSQVMNQPQIKENIKKIVGVVTFIFGLVIIWNICEDVMGRATDRTYESTANIISIFSIIFSATVSKPGVALISHLKGRCFSKAQTETIFGENTIFLINPWHPRHFFSFLAVGFSVAGFVSTDAKLRGMLLFNTLTSRPFLHTANQLVSYTQNT